MATVSILLVFLLYTTAPQFAASLVLPITKHAPTNQHFIRVGVGTRPEPISLLVDLNNPTLWLHCASSDEPTTQTPIQCLSIRCSAAGAGCSTNHTATATSHQTCVLNPTNPISKSTDRGYLVEDTVTVAGAVVVEDFLLTCVPRSLLQGLAGGARGVFGLGKTSRISPISQIAHKLDISRKFSLCLSGNQDRGSAGGAIFVGTVTDRVMEISRSMVYTPLSLPDESTPTSADDYSIRVKSVEINGRKISSLPGGSPIRARISSVDPFTKLNTATYRTILRGFVAATSESLNLMRVEESGSGFELCYSTAGGAVEVDDFPVIDLVLQSELVKWRIQGHNLMVGFGGGEKLVCLGLVDGGSDMEVDEIVIGAHQIEDNLLEFDLGSGMLGISSSLLMKGTSCSRLSGTSGGSHPAS